MRVPLVYSDVKARMELMVQTTEPRYTCNRGPRASGAMIECKDGSALFGYVEPTLGSSTCGAAGCMMENEHCVRNLHAEVDAILKAARTNHTTKGATIYSINKPCFDCTKHIIAAGIGRIYYMHVVYDEERTRRILNAAGVVSVHVPID